MQTVLALHRSSPPPSSTKVAFKRQRFLSIDYETRSCSGRSNQISVWIAALELQRTEEAGEETFFFLFDLAHEEQRRSNDSIGEHKLNSASAQDKT